jgi:outer membrane protein assembly factor BamB
MKRFGFDAPWLVLGLVTLLGLSLLTVHALGADRQRFARERKLDTRTTTLVTAIRGESTPDVPAVPPEVAAGAGEWPLANHDYANTRATTSSRIDSGTVNTLGLSWQRGLRGASKWGTAASGPLIAKGVLYFQDLSSNVFAIDVESGSLKWKHVVRQKAFGPNGPAIGWGKLYAQNGDRHIVALDLVSGKELWRTPLGGPTGQQQPIAYGGLLLTGIAAGRKARGSGRVLKTALLKSGASGFAYALREHDGSVAWEFQTVTEGFWGNPDVNSGAGIWFPAAIDQAERLTYWSTGNPAPAPGTGGHPNGSSRPGPNLYSDSMLALRLGDGKLVWHHQVVPHELYHHDFQNSPILAEVAGRKLVVGSGKLGIVYAFDRQTGRLVWKRPVGRHENDDLKSFPLGKVIKVYPGFWGGVETPGAYADGTLYFEVVNMPTPYTATAWMAKDGQTSVEHLEARTEYDQGTSELVAIDAATGAIKWSRPFPAPGFGAATVVNDLVFTATYDGKIYAVSRADGKIVWRFQAPGGINAWPAVAGDVMVWPVGLGRKPVLLALKLGSAGKPVKPDARPALEDEG